MVRLAENKSFTEGKPIEAVPLPPLLYIPLAQHLGKAADKILVKPGDAVQAGQLIATAEAKVFAQVHASCDGTVVEIKEWPHPVLGTAKAVVIASKPSSGETVSSKAAKTQDEAAGLSAAQIRELVFKAGVVGMGGASFPTHIKLTPPKPVTDLIINIAECEPYLTGDSRLVEEHWPQILPGIELVRKASGAKNVFIAIEDNKPEAISTIARSSLPDNYTLKVIPSGYPQGGEKQLVKSVLRKEVPSGKLPFDVAATVQNVSTVFAVYEAVYKEKPLYQRVVTVTGSILKNPKNVLAAIGTPIRHLIEFCGPLSEEPAKIIIGGPMMGFAQYSDQVPVIKSTNGVVLFSRKEAAYAEEDFCIRCGACIRNCPMGLMPCQIDAAAEKELWEQAKAYRVADCIECGSCNFVCPAKRRIVQSVKRAKLELQRLQ